MPWARLSDPFGVKRKRHRVTPYPATTCCTSRRTTSPRKRASGANGPPRRAAVAAHPFAASPFSFFGPRSRWLISSTTSAKLIAT